MGLKTGKCGAGSVFDKGDKYKIQFMHVMKLKKNLSFLKFCKGITAEARENKISSSFSTFRAGKSFQNGLKQ